MMYHGLFSSGGISLLFPPLFSALSSQSAFRTGISMGVPGLLSTPRSPTATVPQDNWPQLTMYADSSPGLSLKLGKTTEIHAQTPLHFTDKISGEGLRLQTYLSNQGP